MSVRQRAPTAVQVQSNQIISIELCCHKYSDIAVDAACIMFDKDGFINDTLSDNPKRTKSRNKSVKLLKNTSTDDQVLKTFLINIAQLSEKYSQDVRFGWEKVNKSFQKITLQFEQFLSRNEEKWDPIKQETEKLNERYVAEVIALVFILEGDLGNIDPSTNLDVTMYNHTGVNDSVKEVGDLAEELLGKELERITDTDPLYELNSEEKWRVFDNRERLKTNPKALPKFLTSVPWQQPYAVHIAHQLLQEWSPISSIDALELLDYNYGSAVIRQYSIDILNQLSDNELSDFVLQLVQTLKYELYHDSPLTRFLLQRALRNTHQIGHILFWHLKAEMHVPYIRERYGLLLEEYLKHCGSHRRDLLKQCGIIDQLTNIANLIKEAKKSDATNVLRTELAKLTHPPKFKLPLSPRLEVKGVIPEKCKVMDSKKLPLWLVFENADQDAPPVYVMFKAGDDIRQDLLTLQMLKTMDQMWKSEGLDFHMQPYGCVCLGDMIGMIEIVLNSDTIANITAARGGASAAFQADPLHLWLKQNNSKPNEWDTVVDNFVWSCAGYCVATYVLGIGDRHNDNIMLTRKGDLFHIDFGHFLGNFKTFKGIYKRETTPFVFTPMYAHVMGGEGSEHFNRYSELSCRAFNIIRKNGRVIMNLFLLMLATGIPELRSIDDVLWLRNCLVLNKNENDANLHFKKQIKKSLKNTRSQINDAVHIFAHKK